MTKLQAYHGIKTQIRQLEEKREVHQKSKGMSHVLHLLLSILTGGLWVIVWVFLALNKTDVFTPKFYADLEELYQLRDEVEYQLFKKVA